MGDKSMRKLSFLALALCFLFATSCSDDNVNNTEGEFTTKILFYSNYGIVNTPIKKVDVYVNGSFVGAIKRTWFVNTKIEPDCDKFFQDDEEFDKLCVLRLNKKMIKQNEKIRYYAKVYVADEERDDMVWKEVEMDIKSDTCYKILLDIRKVFEK